MSRNNTDHDWTVRGCKPDEGGQIDRVLVARSPCGRVEIEVHQDEGAYWNARDGGHEKGTHYTVSVYASNTYLYSAKHGDGEWAEHELVAHPRSTTSGQGWEPTFESARALVVNSIVAIEKDDKWISGSLSDSHREYVHSRMSREEAVKEVGGMFRATATDTDTIDRDGAVELACESERWQLAEYLYAQSEIDFVSVLMDIEANSPTTA